MASLALDGKVCVSLDPDRTEGQIGRMDGFLRSHGHLFLRLIHAYSVALSAVLSMSNILL